MKKNIKLLSILCCSLLIGTQLNAQCNNSADLDTTFGPQNNGIVFIDFGGTINTGHGGLLTDDQGRIVVSGSTNFGGNLDFAVARLLPNGLLDTSFGAGGKVIIDFGGFDLGLGGVVRDCQGRLIVAGHSNDPPQPAVARLLPDGSLDSTFGTNGQVILTQSATISGIKLNQEGKIVLFGNVSFTNLIVIQLNSDGSLDASFGTNGISEVNFGISAFSTSDFAIDSQGRIIIVGSKTPSPGNFLVARLNPDGSLDSTFGTDGKTAVDIDIEDVAQGGIVITRGGKIVILGTESDGGNDDMVVFQLNNDGSLDTNFGTNGSTSFGTSTNDLSGGITINSKGKIYAFGTNQVVDIFIIARLEKDGSLDPTFGNGGVKTIQLNDTVTIGGGIIISAQGRIVLVGSSENPREFTVVRLCGDELPAFIVALREKYMANCQCN